MSKQLSKKIIHAITIVSLFGVAISSMAMLSLELTQGTRSRLPIAIVSLEGEQALSADRQTSRIVMDDLNHSGEFSVFFWCAIARSNPQALEDTMLSTLVMVLVPNILFSEKFIQWE
ncbi:MAG: hypothetical protein LRY69_02090 [Gammaproteobacteria bacterium]|nr:hypothetical protein [Gammaproteobacteria bacterium]